jgi:hypothetical protein
MRSPRLLAALSACAFVITAACAKAKAPQAETVDKAATVIPIAGTTGGVRIQLTADAVKRLDIQTATVHDASVAPRRVALPDGSAAPAAAPTQRRVIPFSAVMYAPAGDAFAYVVAGSRIYQRAAIAVDYVVGDLAVLTSGPAAGTPVVTVGGPELTGVEFGTGE